MTVTVTNAQRLPPIRPCRGHRRTQATLLIDSVPMLHAYVRPMVRDQATAEEIVQEVSLRILVAAGPREPEKFAAWSRALARHVVARHWRMRVRARAHIELEPAVVEEIGGRANDPEAHLDARVWMARIATGIAPGGLALLYRRYVLEETGRHLADELEQTPAAVRMRLMRLRLAARTPQVVDSRAAADPSADAADSSAGTVASRADSCLRGPLRSRA